MLFSGFRQRSGCQQASLPIPACPQYFFITGCFPQGLSPSGNPVDDFRPEHPPGWGGGPPGRHGENILVGFFRVRASSGPRSIPLRASKPFRSRDGRMVQAICRVSAVYSDGLVFSSQAWATLRSPLGGRGVVALGCQMSHWDSGGTSLNSGLSASWMSSASSSSSFAASLVEMDERLPARLRRAWIAMTGLASKSFP